MLVIETTTTMVYDNRHALKKLYGRSFYKGVGSVVAINGAKLVKIPGGNNDLKAMSSDWKRVGVMIKSSELKVRNSRR